MRESYKNRVWACQLNSSGSEWGSLAGFSEHGIEPLTFIKGKDGDGQLLMEDSVPCNQCRIICVKCEANFWKQLILFLFVWKSLHLIIILCNMAAKNTYWPLVFHNGYETMSPQAKQLLCVATVLCSAFLLQGLWI
jgi:hypothetical protein